MRLLRPLRTREVALLWGGLSLSAVGDQLYAGGRAPVHSMSLDALSFGLSAVALTLIHRRRRIDAVRPPDNGTVRQAVARGARAMAAHPLLGFVLRTTAIGTAPGMPPTTWTSAGTLVAMLLAPLALARWGAGGTSLLCAAALTGIGLTGLWRHRRHAEPAGS